MLRSIILGNISYNTKEFLVDRLNELFESKKIRFWCAIFHKAESGELKDHWHIFIIPDERIETRELDDFFIETVPNSEPLKCMMWTPVTSKYEWFLYCVHDKNYLLMTFKQDKKFHYKKEDFIFSDKNIFEDFWFSAYNEFDFWKESKYKDLFESGISPSKMVKNGYVPMRDMIQFHYFMKSLSSDFDMKKTFSSKD